MWKNKKQNEDFDTIFNIYIYIYFKLKSIFGDRKKCKKICWGQAWDNHRHQKFRR
jgi:hypothetical protein